MITIEIDDGISWSFIYKCVYWYRSKYRSGIILYSKYRYQYRIV